MATRMQQRRGTAAQWISTNNGNGPVLNAGEIGYETDTNKFKIGDGVNHWVDLTYFADTSDLGSDYIPLGQKGAANGVATLNADGVIPSEQIPSLVGLDTEITTAVNNAVDALVAGAPEALNTLNEFAAAIDNDPNFATSVIAALNDAQVKVDGVSNTEIGYLANVTADIQGQIDAKANTADMTTALGLKADTSSIAESAIDALAGALTDGSGINITHDDEANTITIDIDSTVATKTYADDAVSTHSSLTENIHGIDDTTQLATLSGTETLANKTLVYPTITAFGIGGNDATISATELGYLDGVTSNIQDQLDDKANSADVAAAAQDAVGGSIGTGLEYDTVTNVLSIDQTVMQARVADVSDTEIGYLNGVTSAIQTQIDDKLASSTAASTYAPIDSPTFTGTVSGVTKSHVGLGNVDNTSDADKPVSTATQTALDAKASLAGATFTGDVTVETNLIIDGDLTVSGTTTTVNATDLVVSDPLVYIGEGNSANLVDLGLVSSFDDGTYQHSGLVRDSSDSKWKLFKGVTDEPTTTINFAQGSLDALAVGALEVESLTIGDGVLSTQVTNTELSYLSGVTSAIQTQINAKAPTADPTFTGTVSGVTKAHVGLGNVDNTSDANKPVSTATQTALDAKVDSLVSINAKTDSYTLELTDKDKMIEINKSSSTFLFVPNNDSVAFPVGTRIHIVQTGTGQITIDGDQVMGGVTINGTPGLKTRAQWSAVTLVKRATNTWIAFGDLTA